MKKFIIVAVVVIILCVIGAGFYFLFYQKNGSTGSGSSTGGSTGQYGTLPAVAPAATLGANSSATSNLPDYIGKAADVIGNLPTGAFLSIGTARGTVQVNNFYATNPPVVDGGDIVIKQAQSYLISYNPSSGSFWLGITGSPFATWQQAAEADFLATLGVSKADACKLRVTSGAIYSPGNPLDGQSLPLSFCSSGGAFHAR